MLPVSAKEEQLAHELQQKEEQLQKAASMGQLLLDKLRVSEERNRSLKEQLEAVLRQEEQREQEAQAAEREGNKSFALHDKLQKTEHELRAERAERGELELEVQIMTQENERLRAANAAAKEEAERLVSRIRELTVPGAAGAMAGSLSSSSSSRFGGRENEGGVSREELKQELLQAAVTISKLDERVRELEDEKSRLENTVSTLVRKCQALNDELAEASIVHPRLDNSADFLNSSLADELSVTHDGLDDELPSPIKANKDPKPAAAAPVPTAAANAGRGGMFSDMMLQTPSPDLRDPQQGPGGGMFKDMEVHKEGGSGRQYREYVYLSVTAIKIQMALKYAGSDKAELLLKLTPKQVLEKAEQMRIPLHQVHSFVRKYALAFLDQQAAPARPPPPKQGFFSRVLTTYFPSADYLFRSAEVVPNKGSDLGSFLYKKGSFLSRSWKQRWFKLNAVLGVISYHPNPHVLNSLGTINLADIARVYPVPTTEEIPTDPPGPAFVFVIETSWRRQYYLAAESNTMRQLWIDGIQHAVAELATETADRASVVISAGTATTTTTNAAKSENNNNNE